MKRIGTLVAVALAVAAGIWGYFYAQSGGSAPKYRTARVERGPLTAAVSATGNLNAVITVQVGSQVSGQIKELLVDFNSPVRKGQLIARIDPEVFEAKVNQARADVDSAQASVLNQQAQVERARADVENARAAYAEAKAQTAKADVTVADTKRDLGRKSELFKRDLIAKSDLDTAQAASDSAVAQVESARAHEQALQAGIESAGAQFRVAEAMLQSARAQVKQKQAALQQAQVDLDHTAIRAPVDGVVVSRAVDVGQTVAASLQAPVLFTIAQDLTKMQVETSVDEADIGRTRVGGRATFTVDAFPGETFSGTVSQIRKAAQVVQNVVTYTVVVEVANPDSRLLPGMTANVKLSVAEKRAALKVSNAALRFRPAGTEPERGPAGAGGTAAAGQASLENIRDRLVQTLTLTDEQQQKLETILQDSRRELQGLQGNTTIPEWQSRQQTLRVRQQARARIREILTPEQQVRYDQMQSSGGEGRGGVPGRVWIAGPDGKPQAVQVTLGITDGTSTEVLRGDVKEGQEVIVGFVGSAGPPGRSGSGGGGGAPRLRL